MAGRSGQGKSECQKPSGEGTVLARALRRNQPAPVKASGTWRNPLTRSPAGRGKPGLGGTGERKAWADAASRCSRPFSRLWKIKPLLPPLAPELNFLFFCVEVCGTSGMPLGCSITVFQALRATIWAFS